MPHTDFHAGDLPAAFDELEARYEELKDRIAVIDEAIGEDEPISPQNDDGSYSVAQIPLVCAIINHISKRHGNVMMEPRRDNVVIEAANMIVDAYRQPITRATPGMGISRWLSSDDTGQSSLAMARVLCKAIPEMRNVYVRVSGWTEEEPPYPHDPSDFGRCLRLLEAVPELREHLSKMAMAGPMWAAYVARWEEMEKLYREEFLTGSAPKLYELMQAIQEQARKEQPCVPPAATPSSE